MTDRPGGRRRRRSAQKQGVAIPAWLRRRRYQALLAGGLLVSLILGYVWIAAGRVGDITHQSALGVIGDIVSGGRGSSVGQAVADQKPITIALYGYGGDGHDGAYLSDSIMVVMVTPRGDSPTQVTEISVPRDWEVPIDLGNGTVVYGKINEAYAFADDSIYPNRGAQYKGDFGRSALADDTLDRVLGIHIDHHVGLDFHAFQYAVDAVGGVDVTVQRSFTDYQYPNTSCDFNERGCANITVRFNAGLQHMDGATALKFARSRHGDNGEGTDFARSRRQQLILAAVREKIGGIGGIPKVLSVLNALSGHVDTDMSAGDSEQLYNLVKSIDSSKIEHVSIDDTNFLFDCNYPTSCNSAYLWPHDGTYASVQKFIAHVVPDPVTLAEHAAITVEDASGDGGVASARWAKLLTEIGFTATDGGSVPARATSAVVAAAGATGTAAWLSSTFATPPAATPSPPPTTAGGTGTASGTATGSGTAPASSTAAAAQPAVTLVLGRAEEAAFNADPGGPGAANASVGGYYTAPPRTQRPTARPTPVTTAAPASFSATSSAIATPPPTDPATPDPTPAPPTPTAGATSTTSTKTR
ncbi:MAG TPA: LCP family protein [Candidatus Dormibacteraeota bacterium]|nr:LCP family protein [Candidatus Dormibacteraeota bacterium]